MQGGIVLRHRLASRIPHFANDDKTLLNVQVDRKMRKP
jgi:hypothetical protein